MWHRFSSVLLACTFSASALVGSAYAAPRAQDECPVAKKVTSLLADWKTATAEARNASAASQSELAAVATKLASSCPVGSRMGSTLAALRDTLATAVRIDEELSAHCPVDQAPSTDADFAAAKKLKAARGVMLRQLESLAQFTAEGMPCCAAASAGAESPAKAACSAEEACCPIRIASRLGGLKVEWTLAAREAAALGAAKRDEILTGFRNLSARSKALSLMPQSVTTLVEGFDALDKIHAEMKAWIAQHPDALKDVPQAAQLAFGIQTALLDEARQVLAGATKAMGALHGKPSAETARAHSGSVSKQ